MRHFPKKFSPQEVLGETIAVTKKPPETSQEDIQNYSDIPLQITHDHSTWWYPVQVRLCKPGDGLAVGAPLRADGGCSGLRGLSVFVALG